MANAWDMNDDMLTEQLEAWIAWVATGDDWTMVLYINDFTPVPGTVYSDYEPADFPGYLDGTIPAANWGAVAVVAHVAKSVNASPCVFVANDTGFVSQTIYGYAALDGDGNYRYGERFTTPKSIEPGDTLTVTAIMRQATYPN